MFSERQKIKPQKVFFIPGVRSTIEAIKKEPSGIYEIWFSQDSHSNRFSEIIDMAGKKDIPCLGKQREILDHILPGVTHQGVVALTKEFAYTGLGEFISSLKNDDGHHLIIAVDHITDEGNLGAIIRSAVFFGAHGIILPKDRSAGITHNVIKRSSGACIHIPVVSVINFGRTLDTLNENGYWIIGTAGDGNTDLYDFDWKRGIVLVLGSEGKGIRPGTRKRCHEIISIPPQGSIRALNVSVACGVILSEIIRQRR